MDRRFGSLNRVEHSTAVTNSFSETFALQHYEDCYILRVMHVLTSERDRPGKAERQKQKDDSRTKDDQT